MTTSLLCELLKFQSTGMAKCRLWWTSPIKLMKVSVEEDSSQRYAQSGCTGAGVCDNVEHVPSRPVSISKHLLWVDFVVRR